MSLYTQFFLNSMSSVVPLETLEISHPSFSQVHNVVRNSTRTGITATLETGVATDFVYYPLQIKPTSSQNDLDQKLQIQLGDLGELVPNEIDNCFAAGTMLTKPIVNYRVFRSDDLTKPMDGPFRYEITTLSMKQTGSGFAAEAPRLNTSRTGEIYTIDRFPMLAGVE